HRHHRQRHHPAQGASGRPLLRPRDEALPRDHREHVDGHARPAFSPSAPAKKQPRPLGSGRGGCRSVLPGLVRTCRTLLRGRWCRHFPCYCDSAETWTSERIGAWATNSPERQSICCQALVASATRTCLVTEPYSAGTSIFTSLAGVFTTCFVMVRY